MSHKTQYKEYSQNVFNTALSVRGESTERAKEACRNGHPDLAAAHVFMTLDERTIAESVDLSLKEMSRAIAYRDLALIYAAEPNCEPLAKETAGLAFRYIQDLYDMPWASTFHVDSRWAIANLVQMGRLAGISEQSLQFIGLWTPSE